MMLNRRTTISALVAVVAVAVVVVGGRLARRSIPQNAPIVMVVGDSLADGLASGLHRLDPWHARYRILNETRISSGLMSRDGYDLTAALPQLLREHRPNAVILFIGLNDARRDSALLGSEGWEQKYRARIAGMLDIAEQASIPAIWVGLPVMRDPDLQRATARLNELYRDEAGSRRNATLVDLWELTGGSDASYKPYRLDAGGNLEKFREQDGIHFTAFGYDVLARRILEALGRALDTRISLPSVRLRRS